jgi:hypothetical protein
MDDANIRGQRAARPDTGWKPMLQYAVASSRWVRGDIGKNPGGQIFR